MNQKDEDDHLGKYHEGQNGKHGKCTGIEIRKCKVEKRWKSTVNLCYRKYLESFEI